MATANLLKALAVTAELLSMELSPAAAAVLAQDLDGFPEDAVLGALVRCRRELSPGKFCAAAILARIDDGRPGAETAWAMLPQHETQTVVWTDEMIKAWAVAKPLLDDGERVTARMAFKETYAALVAGARDERRPVAWRVSVGTDKHEAERVLAEAVELGRLSAGYAALLLPYTAPLDKLPAALAYKPMPLLENERGAP